MAAVGHGASSVLLDAPDAKSEDAGSDHLVRDPLSKASSAAQSGRDTGDGRESPPGSLGESQKGNAGATGAASPQPMRDGDSEALFGEAEEASETPMSNLAESRGRASSAPDASASPAPDVISRIRDELRDRVGSLSSSGSFKKGSPTPGAPARDAERTTDASKQPSSSGGGGAALPGTWGAEAWQNFELIRKNILAVGRPGRRGGSGSSGRAASPSANLLAEISDYDSDDEDARCQCKKAGPGVRTCADNTCINYATSTECPKGRCNPGCSNQNLQLRNYADVEVFHTGNDAKGHGIRVKTSLRENSFVIEYVGEVIDAEELERRMTACGQGTNRLYMMQLGHNQYLDAKRRGGIARYINHSCEPNCRLERWRAGRHMRCAVFADRNISAGEELSFDYKWTTRKNRRKTKCLCGTGSCRGTLEIDDFGEASDPMGIRSNGFFRMPRAEDIADPQAMLERRVRIFWDGDQRNYQATVVDYVPEKGVFLVEYDGDSGNDPHEERLTLDNIKGAAAEDPGKKAAAEKPEGKKAEGSGTGNGAVWEIWEESEKAVVIARREKASDSSSGVTDMDIETDSEEGRREAAPPSSSGVLQPLQARNRQETGRAVRWPPPPPFRGGRVMSQHFILPADAARLLLKSALHINTIQIRSGATLHAKTDDIRLKDGPPGCRIIITVGGREQVALAESLVREIVVKLCTPEEFELIKEQLGTKKAGSGSGSGGGGAAAAAVAAAATDLLPRPRKRWCFGSDWHAFAVAEVDAGMTKATEPRRKSALQAIRQVGTSSGTPREVLLHAAVLLQRYLAIVPAAVIAVAATAAATAAAASAGEGDTAAAAVAAAAAAEAAKAAAADAAVEAGRQEGSVFYTATACLLLANKAVRARAPSAVARPVKTAALLTAAYSRHYPGRQLVRHEGEGKAWEEKVLAAENSVLKALGFDLYLADPIKMLRNSVAAAAAAALAATAAAAAAPALEASLLPQAGDAAGLAARVTEKGVDLLLEAALQGASAWLKYPTQIVAAATSLLAAATCGREPLERQAQECATAAGSVWPTVTACCGALSSLMLNNPQETAANALLTEMTTWPRPKLAAAAAAALVGIGGATGSLSLNVKALETMPRAPDFAGNDQPLRTLDVRELTVVALTQPQHCPAGARVLRACVSEAYLRSAGLGRVLDADGLPPWDSRFNTQEMANGSGSVNGEPNDGRGGSSGSGGRRSGNGADGRRKLYEVSLVRWPSDGRRESGDVGISSTALIELVVMQRLHGQVSAAVTGASFVLLPLTVVRGLRDSQAGSGSGTAPAGNGGSSSSLAGASPSARLSTPDSRASPNGTANNSVNNNTSAPSTSSALLPSRDSALSLQDGLTNNSNGAPGSSKDELLRPNYLLVPPIPYTLAQAVRACRHGGNGSLPLPPPLLRGIARELLLGAAQCHELGYVLKGADALNVHLTFDGKVRLGGLGTASMASVAAGAAEAGGGGGGAGPPKVPAAVAAATAAAAVRDPVAFEQRKRKAQMALDALIKREGDIPKHSLPNAAPEVLLGLGNQTMATDAWAFGCLVLSLALGRPLFNGKSRQHHLGHIFKTCGTVGPDNWPEGAQSPYLAALEPLDAQARPLDCRPRLPKVLVQSSIDPQLSEVLCGLLELDPKRRWTLQQAASAAYFAGSADNDDEEESEAERALFWEHMRKCIDRDDRYVPPPPLAPPPQKRDADGLDGYSGKTKVQRTASGSSKLSKMSVGSSDSEGGGGRGEESAKHTSSSSNKAVGRTASGSSRLSRATKRMTSRVSSAMSLESEHDGRIGENGGSKGRSSLKGEEEGRRGRSSRSRSRASRSGSRRGPRRSPLSRSRSLSSSSSSGRGKSRRRTSDSRENRDRKRRRRSSSASSERRRQRRRREEPRRRSRSDSRGKSGYRRAQSGSRSGRRSRSRSRPRSTEKARKSDSRPRMRESYYYGSGGKAVGGSGGGDSGGRSRVDPEALNGGGCSSSVRKGACRHGRYDCKSCEYDDTAGGRGGAGSSGGGAKRKEEKRSPKRDARKRKEEKKTALSRKSSSRTAAAATAAAVSSARKNGGGARNSTEPSGSSGRRREEEPSEAHAHREDGHSHGEQRQ